MGIYIPNRNTSEVSNNTAVTVNSNNYENMSTTDLMEKADEYIATIQKYKMDTQMNALYTNKRNQVMRVLATRNDYC